jgi:hypothetical protein
MPDRHAQRRVGLFRQRAQQLTEAAKHVWRDESRRRHMLDLAATYERVVDTLSPMESEPAPSGAMQQKVFAGDSCEVLVVGH